MAETLQYTATLPTAQAGTKTSALKGQQVPNVAKRLLGIKLLGNRKVIIEVLDGAGPHDNDAYRYQVLATGATEDAARTDIDAWYALLGTTGSVTPVENDYAPGELDNMCLFDITQDPPNLLAGKNALLTLHFARYI